MPSAIFEFLTSTKSPTLILSPISQLGLIYAKGPTLVPFPILLLQTTEFKIVVSTEANSLKGLISNESPLGLALLGKKKGAIVEVEAPVGVVQYKILEIQRSM